MPEKKPDDVMAEYLLKGAKMLAKTCPSCGSPLFDYKDRTFCVMCEMNAENDTLKTKKGPGRQAVAQRGKHVTTIPATELACALETTLITLSERIACEPDPDRCLVLMDTLGKGIESLKLLTQP
jgi:UPF0148 protein